MLRKLLVAVYYVVLVYYLVRVGPSVFLLLMSLWCEMVLMFLLFAVFSFGKQPEKVTNVFMASVPILFCMYIILIGLGSALDEFKVPFDSLVSSAPLITFSAALIPMALSLILIYTLNAVDFIRKKQDIEVIESGLRFQMMLLIILGFAGILFGFWLGKEHLLLVVILLGLVRVIFEPLLDRMRAA